MADTVESLRQEWEQKREVWSGPFGTPAPFVERLLAALEAAEQEREKWHDAWRRERNLTADSVNQRNITLEARVAKLRAALERAERTFRSYDMAQSADEVTAVLKETKQC